MQDRESSGSLVKYAFLNQYNIIALVGAVGYALNSVITTYPEFEEAIRGTLTPRGEDLLKKVQDQCIAETITKFMFRHLQPYFNSDIYQLVNEELFKTLFDMQRIGRYKPNAPVMILSNRYDPLVPWTGANQLGRDWCAQGADVEFWTKIGRASCRERVCQYV